MEDSVLEQLRFATATEINEGYQLALLDPFSLSEHQSISAALHMTLILSLHEFDRSPFIVHGNYALQPRGVLHFCAVLLNPRNEVLLASVRLLTNHQMETLLPGKRYKIAQDIPGLFEDVLRQVVCRSCDQRALATDLHQMATLAIDFGDSNVLRQCMEICHGYNGVLAAREVLARLRHYYHTFQARREGFRPGCQPDVLRSRHFARTITTITFEQAHLETPFVCLRCGVVSYHPTSDACQCSPDGRVGPNQQYYPDRPASSWDRSSCPSIAPGTSRGQLVRREVSEAQESQEAPVYRSRLGPPSATGNYVPSRSHDNFVCIRCGAVSHGSSDTCRCSSGANGDSDSPFDPDRRVREEPLFMAPNASQSSQIDSTLAAGSGAGRNDVPTRGRDDRKMFSCAIVRVASEFLRRSSFFARAHSVLTLDPSVDDNARRETYRLSSFRRFRFNALPLVRAGFFHLGITDAVRCFSCHVIVADWRNSVLGLSRWHLASCFHNRNLPTGNRSIGSFRSPSRPLTQRACQRCIRRRATVAFLPCGHLCFCSQCAGAPDLPTRCPRCWGAVPRAALKP